MFSAIAWGCSLYYNYNNTMETLKITKIVKVGTSLAVVLPVSILKALEWQRGDTLLFAFLSDDSLTIRRLSDSQIRRLNSDDIINLT